MDAKDPLRGLRGLFTLPDGVIYLDGNSLGVLPKATSQRVARAITEEWGQGLIRSWNSAGWFELPQRLGDKIAQLIGARPGEVVATDSTSINLYKVLSAAIRIAHEKAPHRKVVSERAKQLPDRLVHRAGALQGARLAAATDRRRVASRPPSALKPPCSCSPMSTTAPAPCTT